MSQLFVMLACSIALLGPEYELNGQAAAWIAAGDTELVGLRYAPSLTLLWKSESDWRLESEISVVASTQGWFDSLSEYDDQADCKLYRGWLRWSDLHSEIRAGLQKINFGPARILRSLRWFDQTDVRDPLEATPGVWALLVRHYFINNAGIWLWGLSGNDDPKGLEIVATKKNTLEGGGRCQFSLWSGELGVSYHQRRVDLGDWPGPRQPFVSSEGIEERYALDGTWDIGPGIWFEAFTGRTRTGANNDFWQNLVTCGTDYTFTIGAGVQVTLEHLYGATGSDFDHQHNSINNTVVSATTSVSLLDNLTVLGGWSWPEQERTLFLNWQRLYDRWEINTGLFSGPGNGNGDSQALYQGDGCQLMILYHY
ncbi:hypothetical protein JXQ70_15835 [bacterium]|nr:hypothetical protein [bacterium]